MIGGDLRLDLADPDPPPPQQAIRAKSFHRTGTFVPFPADAIEQSVTRRFEEQVRRFPGRPAVRTRRHALTYGELNAVANRIAHAILSRSANDDKAVALLFDHDASVIAAMLGTLKAGKFYVPLDPSYPRERLDYVLRDSMSALLLTDGRNLALARQLTGGAIEIVDVDGIDGPSTDPATRSGPASLALLLYTSGSTGQPKGSAHSHRNVLHDAMHYTNSGHFCADDRFLLVSSVSFADSVRTIYSALLNGASLYPFPLRAEGFGSLAGWMLEHSITIYRSVPTTFRHFVDSLTGSTRFPDVRLIYFAGEPVYPSDADRYKRHFSRDCILVNRLGTTETFTFRCYFIDHDTDMSGSRVPVGYAVPGKEVLLVDERGELVAPGQIGEMTIRSRYLSPGYWRKPDLTHLSFSADPSDPDVRLYRTGDLGRLHADGCLEHIGRKDSQVKIRGHRIEPSEVEAALFALGVFTEAVVVISVWGDEAHLVAYVVPASESPPSVGALRGLVAARLPGYMIPSRFVLLDSLPLLPNGKVNRRGLPVPGKTRPDLDVPFVAPRNALEDTIAQTWAEVLGLDRVGVDDHFLEIGGDSLAAMRIIARVADCCNARLPAQLFWDVFTVARMAEIVGHASQNASPAS